jgi:hypothetical protein
MERAYSDIDFVGYMNQTRDVQELMKSLGMEEVREVIMISEGVCSIFNHR